LTFLLIMISIVAFVAKSTSKTGSKNKKFYEDTLIDYKVYNKLNENDQKSSILVMSYNIMAYNFTKIEWFPYCQPEFLHPKYRAPRILNEIEKVNADIVCLQECDHDLFSEFYKVNLEALGYNTIFKPQSQNRIVTNVIAYKKSLFKQERVLYLDLNEDLGKLDESFNKHKEAYIVKLKQKSTGKDLIIVNTHLFWNPDHEYVKYGQISKIIKYVEDNFSKDIPVIFAGDMNSTPNSNVVKYIYKKAPEVNMNIKGDYAKNKKYIDQFWKESKHSLELRSAYDVYKVSSNKDFEEYADNHADFTTYTHEFIGTLDYILYSSKLLEVVELLKVPTHDTEVKGLRLPNNRYPSDHLKIGARFRLL